MGDLWQDPSVWGPLAGTVAILLAGIYALWRKISALEERHRKDLAAKDAQIAERDAKIRELADKFVSHSSRSEENAHNLARKWHSFAEQMRLVIDSIAKRIKNGNP